MVIKMPLLHPQMHGKFSLTVEGRASHLTEILHGDEFALRDGRIDVSRIRFSIERSGDRLVFEGKTETADCGAVTVSETSDIQGARTTRPFGALATGMAASTLLLATSTTETVFAV